MPQRISSLSNIITYAENIPYIFEKKFGKSLRVTSADVAHSLKKIFSDPRLAKICEDFKGRKISLKPNMAGIYPKDVKGLTTSMEVVEGVILFLKNSRRSFKYSSLNIIESTSINLPNSSDYMFQITGLEEIAQKHGVPLIDAKKDSYFKIKKKFSHIDELLVSKELQKTDILINIPVMKGYPFTLCCKNLMGLLADPYKPKMHTDLKNKVPELACILRPTINIVDGIYGAMNHAGDKIRNIGSKKFNTILVSLDPLATDYCASKMWGYKNKKVSTLNFDYAEGIRLGKLNYKIAKT